MNGFVPTYCSKCGMRMVPPPNLCACQPAPAERVEQIIDERDRLRAVNADLLAALQAQPEDVRGCTCLSMTAYDCPFCLRRAAISRATGAA